ncbi:MAG: MBG domain-containing protein, partial [Micrococcales bacterium]
VFGDNDPALPWEFFDPSNTNLVGTDSISGSLSRDKVGTHAGELVGLYEINTGNLSANNVNYDIQYSIPNDEAHPGEYGYLIITKKDITITAANKTKMYGNNDPALTWTASPSSLTNGENVALGMTGSISRADGQDVGTYSIGQGTLDNANYNITFVDGTFTITPRPIRVRFDDKSKVYGAAEKTLTAYNEVRWNTADLGLVYGDTIASIMTGTAARAVGENVGEYAITHDTMLSNANYTITWVNGKYTITPRPLHLDAADSTKVYGEADPTGMLDWTLATVAAGAEEGLVSPDTDSIITGTAARAAGQNVGDYSITKGTLSAGSNYTLSFSTGKLTITKRPIAIAPDAKSKVYGALNPTSYTYSVVSGSYAYSETSLVGNIAREWGEEVGDYGYILSWSFIYNNPNYSVTIDPTSTNKFSITKRDITITSDDDTKQYGQSDPSFTYTFTTAGLSTYGYLPNGQYVYFHGALSRADREDVGAWDIEQGTLYPGLSTDTIDNWNVTFVKGKLTITKRDLDVYAADQEKIYGDEGYPDNSVSLDEGALAFDDAIDGASFAYNVASPTDAGTYDIIPSAATFSSGQASNYNITYHKGTLTINKRVVHMAVANKEKFYGENDPTDFTITAVTGVDHEGFVGEDSGSGTPGREPGNNVGDYNYTVGTLSGGSNYTIILDSGKLTIKKLVVKIQPKANQEKTYGDLDPTYTYSTDIPLPYGESLNGTLGRESGEDVDTYDFTLNDLDSSNSTNYEVSIDASNVNTFKINKKDITVTIEDIEKYYGEDDPDFEYTYSPATLANGEVIEVKSGSPSRAEGEDAGNYAISKNDIDFGSNFNATINTGSPKLTIKPRPIEVTADDKSSTYGDASLPDNSFEITDGAMQNGETLDSVTFTYNPASPAHAGTYSITPSAAVLGNGGKTSNYAFTYVAGSLVISKAKLTITIDNANIHWGEDTPDFKVLSTDGLVGSDAIGDITYSTDGSTTIATDPGNYVLDGDSLDNMDSGSLDDYEVEFVPGNYVIDPPFAINFSPSRGPIAGGTPFTILGLGFGFNNPKVYFDGVEATGVVLVDSGKITGFTPEHPEGLVNVTLETEWGIIDLGKVFTYFPPPPAPKIRSLGPIQGPTDGGTELTIDGSAFIGSDGKVGKIYIDGVLIKNPKFSRDGKTLIIKTGKHVLGKVDIKVVTKDGAFTYKDAFEYIPGLKTMKVYFLFDGDSSKLRKEVKKALDKLSVKLMGKADLAINANGWVHRTRKTDIDAELSLGRATNVVNYLQGKGIVADFTINGKGIYNVGNDTDRRTELDISWTE